MAQYNVKHSCGHEEKIQLFGKETDRARRIAYLEEKGVCSECYAKAQQEKAQAFATENVLPELSGSEKQIAWAEKIRAEKLANLKKIAENAQKVIAQIESISDEKKEEVIAKIGVEKMEEMLAKQIESEQKHIDAYENAKGQVEARWWIDNRF